MNRSIASRVSLVTALVVCAGLAGVPATQDEATDFSSERLAQVLQEAIDTAEHDRTGTLPGYIPALTAVDPDLLAIAVVTVDGRIIASGDADYGFAIMSAAKPFTMALVMEALGADAIVDKIGVEPTGLPFDSIEAIEKHPARAVNPLVNAGALAAVSLVPGATPDERWDHLLQGYRRFAGAQLDVIPEVYGSVRDGGLRNRAIARLLFSYGRLYSDPEEVRDVYNRQSSVGVTARHLATMGATLAAGGVNPVTGERVIAAAHVPQILAVMTMAGMYDASGVWAFRVGLPAKSGVGGGIVAVAPGRMAVAAFSPRLDDAGNSVRAAQAIEYVADELQLGVFETSAPTNATRR